MKKIALCFVLSILTISCSNDENLESIQEGKIDSKLTISFPSNPKNRMDFVGKEYYSKLNQFYENNETPNSITEITGKLNYLSNRSVIKSETSRGIISFTDEIVESIMQDPDNCMIQIVNSSSLSSEAKTSIITFLLELINQRQFEFNVACGFILSYENDLIGNNLFIDEEEDTLLTISSISRYSLYSEAERKDRDWETSVGSKPGKSIFHHNDQSIISIIAMLQNILKIKK